MLDHSYTYVENLDRQFANAVQEIEKSIAVWYQRFADNNDISLADAKKLLTSGELKELQWTVDEYIKFGKENAIDGAWIKQLENASAKVHISRLDALKLQIQQQAEILHAQVEAATEKAAREIYEVGYYHTGFEVQRGIGLGWSLPPLMKRSSPRCSQDRGRLTGRLSVTAAGRTSKALSTRSTRKSPAWSSGARHRTVQSATFPKSLMCHGRKPAGW